jgi:uncharacterized repeat protein (TIGR01451 family)
VTFTVTVLNRGPSPATNVVANDPLPAGLTFVSAMPSQGTYDQATGVWSVGDLAATQSAVLALRARVTAAGSFTNTASVPNSVNDPDPTNNSASASGTAGVISDLSITKTDGRTTAVPGQRLTYTITVTNGGPSPVVGAPVIDLQPPGFGGVTWFCTATPGGSCGSPSGTGNVDTTVDLPDGGVATITVTGVVSPDAAGIFTNSASVEPPPGATDPDMSDNATQDPTLLTPLADVSITKTGTASATPGSTVTYTIAVTSTGPSTAADVTVTDPTPPGLAFVGNTGDCTTAFPCSLGSLEPGGSRFIVSTYTALAGSLAVNTAMVASSTVDPDIDNNSATAMTALVAVADLAITKTGPAAAPPGGTATYNLAVTNGGPSPAAAVTLTDQLPAGVELVSATSSQGTCTGTTTVICTVGALVAGQTVTATVTVRILPTTTGTLVDTATVSSPTADPSPSNNTASVATAAVAEADLTLTKTMSPEKVDVGQPLTYLIGVTNKGPSPATNVTVTDPLPSQVTPDGAVPSQGSCTVAGQVVTCALGTLAVNATATVTITATRTSPSVFSNTATVTANEFDPNTGDDRATVTTPGASAEICGNCIDDDGNGLIDYEDPACCPHFGTLTVSRVRIVARGRNKPARMKIVGRLTGGTFETVNPRREDTSVRLSTPTSSTATTCCTVVSAHWMLLFKRTFGFWDMPPRICPPVQDLSLVRKSTGAGFEVRAPHIDPALLDAPDLKLTLRVGDRCATGSVPLRRTRSTAVFP